MNLQQPPDLRPVYCTSVLSSDLPRMLWARWVTLSKIDNTITKHIQNAFFSRILKHAVNSNSSYTEATNTCNFMLAQCFEHVDFWPFSCRKWLKIHCYPMLGRIFSQLVWKSFWNCMQTIMLRSPRILQQKSFKKVYRYLNPQMHGLYQHDPGNNFKICLSWLISILLKGLPGIIYEQSDLCRPQTVHKCMNVLCDFHFNNFYIFIFSI